MTANETLTGSQDGNLPVEFKFEDRAVRTLTRGGEIWFVAADVCGVLEHSNPRTAIARLDDDEKGVTSVYTLGGMQELNIINQFGLYSLILSSRKPQAKAFKRWVTHEVLPAISRTGRYAVNEQACRHPNPTEGVRITFPGYGRYSVTLLPDGNHHIFRTEFESLLQDDTQITAELLCHQLKMIDVFWHKVQILQSVQGDPKGSFVLDNLERCILHGGELGGHFLRTLSPRDGI